MVMVVVGWTVPALESQKRVRAKHLLDFISGCGFVIADLLEVAHRERAHEWELSVLV